MTTQRQHERGARWLLAIIASGALLVVIAVFATAAMAQAPQDFKVCSDTSCVQIIVTPVAPPCPVKPADQTQPGVCPAGTTGSWTQTQTYSAAPPPQCWTPSGYLPIAAPAGSCVATPPPTPGAPGNLAATFVQNATHPANSNVTLAWSAVAGTTMYEVWRCTGANCTNFGFLQGGDAPLPTHTVLDQPPGTAKYKVRAWKPVTGPYSAVLTVVTPVNPPPPAGAGTATLEWTHDGKNTDGTAAALTGFRILYGTTATALTQSVQLPSPLSRSFIVEKLSPGTYFFAVRAYNGAGTESASSNVASKVVP